MIDQGQKRVFQDHGAIMRINKFRFFLWRKLIIIYGIIAYLNPVTLDCDFEKTSQYNQSCPRPVWLRYYCSIRSYDCWVRIVISLILYDPCISKTKVDFKNRYMISEKIDHIMVLMKIDLSTMKIRTRYAGIYNVFFDKKSGYFLQGVMKEISIKIH